MVHRLCPGWYTGTVDSIATELGDYAAWATETYPKKPFIIAEACAAAATKPLPLPPCCIVATEAIRRPFGMRSFVRSSSNE